jgi:hypothetical protein
MAHHDSYLTSSLLLDRVNLSGIKVTSASLLDPTAQEAAVDA